MGGGNRIANESAEADAMPPRENTTVGYRRNGKKQACEPCRKGKLACDHGSPFCGRCTRRKTTSRCVYHPAPMTRNSNVSSAPLPSPKYTPGVAFTEQTQHSFSPSAPAQEALQPESLAEVGVDRSRGSLSSQLNDPKNNASSPGQPKPGWKEAVFPSSARYYGPTSFSAIFSEQQVKLNEELLDISENIRKHPGAWQFGEPLLGRERPNGPTVRERHTIMALWNIPSKEICEVLLNPTHGSVVRVTTLDMDLMRHFKDTLWLNFEAELAYPRTNERLTILSDALFKNEEKPLPPSPDNGINWADTFMGRNIRFEMLGLFFCYIGLAYRALQDWDPLFNVPENDGRDRMQTAWRMNECAEVCLKMCDNAETVNYLIPALILNIKRLQTGCTGDDTYQMRRLHGDMVTTAITSGLHRLPPYGASKVTAASEFKRRLWSALYNNDKTHASLCGTPPLLTRLFCDVEPCLDLPDGILLLSDDELGNALGSIGPDGWNLSATHYGNTTLLRAKAKLAVIREEILELALGVNVEVSKSRITDIHKRCQSIYDSFPDSLHFFGKNKTAKSSTGGVLYDQSFLLLQYLQNKFLIDRVAIARGLVVNEQSLFDTALEIMDTSLLFWIKRDQLMSFSFNFDWIITYFTIPAAGAICVQLLKTSAGHSSATFSRADAIQKMTLFIAFLEWVRPTDGNYALAQRLRNVVQKVLNYVLEPPTKDAVGTGENGVHELRVTEGEEGDGLAFDPMLMGFNMGAGDLDWLNSVDWTQGSWMEFN